METSLDELIKEEKFTEEDFYPGAPTEEIRSSCASRVDSFLWNLLNAMKQGTDRRTILAMVSSLVDSFQLEDTEEREKVADYIGESMRLVGIFDWDETSN